MSYALICISLETSYNIILYSTGRYVSASFLKCPCDHIIDIHFFLHFRAQYDFLTYLAKFQPIANFKSYCFFFTFISENLRPPLLDLVPRLGCELEKMTSDPQKIPHGLKL